MDYRWLQRSMYSCRSIIQWSLSEAPYDGYVTYYYPISFSNIVYSIQIQIRNEDGNYDPLGTSFITTDVTITNVIIDDLPQSNNLKRIFCFSSGAKLIILELVSIQFHLIIQFYQYQE